MIHLTALVIVSGLSFLFGLIYLAVRYVPAMVLEQKSLLEQAERLALDAIAFAEERARAHLLQTGTKMPGSTKLRLAIVFFRDHACERVLEMFPQGVASWIEAKLGLVRGIPGPAPATSGTPVIDTFLPGVGTVRSCIACHDLVVGGPTRCVPCAEGPGIEDTQPA